MRELPPDVMRATVDTHGEQLWMTRMEANIQDVESPGLSNLLERCSAGDRNTRWATETHFLTDKWGGSGSSHSLGRSDHDGGQII